MVMLKGIMGCWGTAGPLEDDGSPRSLLAVWPADTKKTANPLKRTQLQCIFIQRLKYHYISKCETTSLCFQRCDLLTSFAVAVHCIIFVSSLELLLIFGFHQNISFSDMLYDSGGRAVLCRTYSPVCRRPLHGRTILVVWNDCGFDLGRGTKMRVKILMEFCGNRRPCKWQIRKAFLHFVAVPGKVCKPM